MNTSFCKFIFVTILLPVVISAQIIFDPVTVTASRLTTSIVSDMRGSETIRRGQIEKMPVQSVTELLTYLGYGEFSSRSTGGVQTDFGVRGSSFEQVVILLNGIRMNDPQTGHHNGDLPVTLDEIEKIEILPGHASSMYGPDAFGGVIHVITKAPDNSRPHLRLHGGSFNTMGGALTAQFSLASWKHRISCERSSSTGHRHDTEYLINTAALESHGNLAGRPVSTRLAFTGKDFGANGFYAPLPSWEATRAYSAQSGIVWYESGTSKLKSNIFLRHHRDHFILTIDNPNYYQNKQNTWVGSIETQWNHNISDKHHVALGVEAFADALESANLGDHHRTRAGFFGETAYTLNTNWVLHGGIRWDVSEGQAGQISPTLSLKTPVNDKLALRFSVGRAYRAPTYTELYYVSKYNQGDKFLHPESAWSYESGFLYEFEGGRLDATMFFRQEKDRIDWIQMKRNDDESSDNYWQAMNLGELDLAGISLQLTYRPVKPVSFKVNYTYMERNIKNSTGVISKYAWSIPKHRCMVHSSYKILNNLDVAGIMRYIQRGDGEVLWLGDTKVRMKWGRFQHSLNLKNIFDVEYEEIKGAPLPGRHFILSTGYTL
ncbi:TonB-dependent receptor [bacterium]|nr:TonB-dependent receptor [bacterium]